MLTKAVASDKTIFQATILMASALTPDSFASQWSTLYPSISQI